jgi:hypothetical protein
MKKLFVPVALAVLSAGLPARWQAVDLRTPESTPTPQQLEAGFHQPPQSARPLTLWMWINSNVTREGITADLESFKKVGLAGTQQFLIGGPDSGTETTLDNPSLVFMSDQWRSLESFAVSESARLGLDFGTHNSPGWSSSGGPWVTPAQSMQKVISGEVAFKGPGQFKGKLPTGEILKDYYGDIAVLAFKTQRYTGPNISTGVPSGMSGQFPVGVARGTPIAAVPQDSIVDLTGKMAADGTLTWDAPAGDWIIARIGHTTTGKTNVAAPAPGTGLECDKMNKEAVAAYYAAYPAKLLADAGKLAGTTFKRFEIDSYEAGPQDWTPLMREEFQKRRGYDMIPWLVYVTRRDIVDPSGHDLSERFQNDWNLTISELFAENYYGTLQKLIHQTPGMQFMFEPYNTSRYSPMDTNNVSEFGDLITAEFWQRPSTWGWTSVKPTTSSAHTWGMNVVAAEAFTGQPDYAFQSDPYLLKATGDRAFALGVNRLAYHTSALQPWMNVAPGMTMGQFGTHFGRTITWWEHGAKEWITYQSRAQYLLQQGTFVGDLCFLQYDRRVPAIPTGYDGDNVGTEVILHRMTVKDGRLMLPDGISYAALVLPNRTTMSPELLRKLKELVNDGAVVIGPRPTASPGLTNYPACDAEVDRLAGELWGKTDGKSVTENHAGKGRIFWGIKPEEVLAKLNVPPDVRIESDKNPSPIVWIHRRVGAADIYFVSNQSDAAVSINAEFRIDGRMPELWHAETDTLEQAPLWTAGKGATEVPLALDPSGSVFVVFRAPAAGAGHAVKFTRDGQSDPALDLKKVDAGYHLTAYQPGDYQLTLAGGGGGAAPVSAKVAPLPAPVDLSTQWEVHFPPKLGAPEKIDLDKLMNLSEHPTFGVKYFSGTATYSKGFDLPESAFAAGRVLRLDLGTVKNVAEVRLNGHDLPLMWLPPFRAEVTPLLKPGHNTLEVRVTNLWVNRLIGDEQLPDDLEWGPLKKLGAIQSGHPLLKIPDWINNPATRPSKERVTFVTFKHYRKDSPLPPSGLIGPVRIESGASLTLHP